jgi:hypothetical protein
MTKIKSKKKVATKPKSKALNKPVVSGSLPSDAEMLDFLQKIMTNDDDYCEVYLAGLRGWTGKASAFQFETNPEKIPTLNKPTLREAIAEAMKFVGNDR